MNYEEYAARMTAQKRKPVEREHYEEIIEKAYMALGEVDKDEFCGLSDKVIGAVRLLADRAEKAELRECDANELRSDAQNKLAEADNENRVLRDRIRELEASAKKTAEELCAEIAKRNAVIDALLARMPKADLRDFVIAR